MGLTTPALFGFSQCGSTILHLLVWLAMLGQAHLLFLMLLLHSQQKLELGIESTFGNIFHRKKRICARLKGIQTALGNNPNNFLIELEKSLLSELSTINTLEAEFWSMKSRISWVVEGDRNTALFHNSTLIRRRRNRITSLKDRMGNWLNGETEIANFIRQGFLDLFTTSHCNSPLKEWQPPFWKSKLNDDDICKLELSITDEDIFATLRSLKPYKAPGPDRLHVGFFQRFWPVVGPSVKA